MNRFRTNPRPGALVHAREGGLPIRRRLTTCPTLFSSALVGRRRRFPICAAILLIALPLMAEEGGGKAELSPIWDVLNFVILAALLGYLIAKNMGPMLVARSQQIHEGLAAGERAKAAADARAAAVEAKLADLGQAIAQMKASSKEEREREAERIRRDTEAEFARIQQHAQQEIESAGKLARIEVQRFAAKLAIDLAEQKVRARMSAQTQTDLLNNFIGEIAGSTSHLG